MHWSNEFNLGHLVEGCVLMFTIWTYNRTSKARTEQMHLDNNLRLVAIEARVKILYDWMRARIFPGGGVE